MASESKRAIKDGIHALLRDHGMSTSQLQHFLDRTIRDFQDEQSSLSEAERTALREHGKNGTAMEKLVIDGLVATQAETFSRHETYTRVCYNKQYDSTDQTLCALRAISEIKALKKLRGVVMKPASEHGKGADMFWIESVSKSNKTISAVVAEDKFGKTPIGDANDKERSYNANRSMQSIAAKLRHAADAFRDALSETFPSYTVSVTKLVITGSPLRQVARDRASNCHIQVWDASHLWTNVWSDDVKEFLTLEFDDKAQTLGV